MAPRFSREEMRLAMGDGVMLLMMMMSLLFLLLFAVAVVLFYFARLAGMSVLVKCF